MLSSVQLTLLDKVCGQAAASNRLFVLTKLAPPDYIDGLIRGRRTQVAREQSAKLRLSGSNPLAASIFPKPHASLPHSRRFSCHALFVFPVLCLSHNMPSIWLYAILTRPPGAPSRILSRILDATTNFPPSAFCAWPSIFFQDLIAAAFYRPDSALTGLSRSVLIRDNSSPGMKGFRMKLSLFPSGPFSGWLSVG